MTNILDSFRLDNKIALVTGATGGLGAGIATALAQAGATVATHDRKPSAEQAAAMEQAGVKLAEFNADLSQKTGAQDLFTQVTEKYGRVDILVNVAGTIHRENAENVTLENWDLVLQINL